MGRQSMLRRAAMLAAAIWLGLTGATAGQPVVTPVAAATIARGGINVEPAARPWQYVGANPDGWWCPGASSCTTSNPLGRIDTEMALAHQLHVANIRVEIPWFLVEPARGSYDWSRADYIFNSASNHGIVLQPILVYTPAWDGGYNAFPVASDFGAFVRAFMTKYGSRISAVEMWNEPDGGQSLLANNPAQYVQSILNPGYAAVKATYPGVQVIEGGSINDSGSCCAWLSGVIAAGGRFDIAAFHDYGGNYAAVVNAYRSIVGGKPIWMGEYGVSDATGSQQSSLITAALTQTAGLAMAQFYTLRDESVYTCCPPAATGEHKQYGVVAANDVTKKSSFYTMQSLLAGSSPPPPPSTTSHPKSAPSPTPAQTSPKASPSTDNGKPSPSHPGDPPSSHPSPSGPLGGLITSNIAPPAEVARALEIILGVLVVAGLALAAWGIALASDMGVLVAPRIGTMTARNRRLLGTGVAVLGLLIAISAVVMLPYR